VHDYDAEVDDLSRDGQAKNTARLRTALNAFIAIDPATLAAGDRDDREMLINSIKGKLLDVETIRYWQKDPDVYTQRDLGSLQSRPSRFRAARRSLAVGHRPRALATGKANIEHPPLAFVDIAIRNVAGLDRIPKDGRPARHGR
jgi:hypothetical protein